MLKMLCRKAWDAEDAGWHREQNKSGGLVVGAGGDGGICRWIRVSSLVRKSMTRALCRSRLLCKGVLDDDPFSCFRH